MSAARPYRCQLQQSKGVALRFGQDALTDGRAKSRKVLQDELARRIFV